MRIQQTGLIEADPTRATPGFTLVTRLRGKAAYLVDMKGEVVHTWELPSGPGDLVYMLPGGRLLATGHVHDSEPLPGETQSRFSGGEGPPLRGGAGGAIREFDWDGTLLNEYINREQHHDARKLPNGNYLYLGWEIMRPDTAARVVGGQPDTEHNGHIYGDYLHEVTPAGDLVWEWHFQDEDIEEFPMCARCYRNEFAHANACFPMPGGDVMVSFRRLNMVAIIDRETRRIRWQHRDDSWGHQHDCQLLDNGNILVFANGIHGGEVPASRVVEFDPETGDTVWQYGGAPPYSFFSPNISGAQRLVSGNTLICEGQSGRVFEVTPESDIVWEYISPFFDPMPNGPGQTNMMFRSYRYAAGSPEIDGRLSAP